MKIPRVMTVREAIYVSLAALIAAAFLELFGGLAVGILCAIAFIGGIYAAVLKWAPDLVNEKPVERKKA